MLTPWDLSHQRHLSRHEESKPGQKKRQEKNKHWKFLTLALNIILMLEYKSLPKSRPRYQPLFSLADISFHCLTASFLSSTLSSTGIPKGKGRWLTRAAQEGHIFQTLQTQCSLVHETNLCYKTQNIAFMYLPTSRQRYTWDMGEWVTPVDTASGLKGSKSKSSKDSSFLASGTSFCWKRNTTFEKTHISKAALAAKYWGVREKKFTDILAVVQSRRKGSSEDSPATFKSFSATFNFMSFILMMPVFSL